MTFLRFFHERLPFKRQANSIMCIQAYRRCKLQRVLVLEIWYCGDWSEMELGWIGNCEVDVSKMPRFRRQRIHEVCMYRVFDVIITHYLKWNIIG